MSEVKVSILLAARNEAGNILDCLQALDALDYPKEEIEIWIGDDGSTDQTAQLVQEYIADKPYFTYHFIDHRLTGLRGKANVLAHLMQRAKGDYFLFCDADITVQPSWCRNMLEGFQPGVGVVVGVTRMLKGNILVDFLSLEWMVALFVIHLAGTLGLPVTGLGNNMAVSRKAYYGVGGYETIGFSVVEDYALFMAIVQKGFSFKMLFSSGILSFSAPLADLKEWTLQRRRWIRGVKDSHLLVQMGIVLAAILFPLLLLLTLIDPGVWAGVLGIHYGAFTLLAIMALLILRQKDLWWVVPFFWPLTMASMSLMLFYYFRSGSIAWKGRIYP
ncbi:glycosyltransferase [Dyadobacter tibetensis]|uniref:glycosyltransferase n=1 Tax=Dyadobacter tibetensis TaxID=1211851 RepID=UPI000470B97C|nr:glycosyltransferase [Dyadobacter tibetensis]